MSLGENFPPFEFFQNFTFFLRAENHAQKKNEDSKKVKLSDLHSKRKTEICHYWEMNGKCKFGEKCAFAHGKEELVMRKIGGKYKTKKCKQYFEKGFCTYGSRCQFSHETESKNFCFIKKINTEKLLTDPSARSFFFRRPRFPTFEKIVHCEEEEVEEKRKEVLKDILEAGKSEQHLLSSPCEENRSTLGSEKSEKSREYKGMCEIWKRKRFESA